MIKFPKNQCYRHQEVGIVEFKRSAIHVWSFFIWKLKIQVQDVIDTFEFKTIVMLMNLVFLMALYLGYSFLLKVE